LQFDTVISSYILIVPLVLLTAAHFLSQKWVQNIARVLILILYPIAFIIASSDIPFFNHFYTRLNTSAFLWMSNTAFSLKMIFQEFTFWVYFIPAIVAIVLFYFFESKASQLLNNKNMQSVFKVIIFSVLSFLLLVAGIRGRFSEKSPIRTGSSYYCENPFLNKMGLNPVFTLFYSLKNDLKNDFKHIQLSDNETALSYTRKVLSSNDLEGISRSEKSIKSPTKYNVILVIMEGMCEYARGKFNGPVNKTPYLNQIEKEGISFGSTYSAGIHTFNGIYSTLYSMPAILKQHPLELYMDIPHYSLPDILAQNGYHNTYITTHDSQFDNASGFLMAHGFHKVIAEDDYHDEEIKSTLGVPDHYLFEYVVNELSAPDRAPFFAAIMTGSLHKPYIIPEDIPFEPKSETEEEQIIEYADWSIHHLLNIARDKPWFENTLFVFIADHGWSYGHTYDLPLSGHRIPFFIYSPTLVQPERRNQLASQMDVGPTILSLLNIEYTNTTLGINLFEQKHDAVFFCADDRIGCIDETCYWLQRNDGRESLYQYQKLDFTELINTHKPKADSLKNHAYNMLQTAQYLYSNRFLAKPVN
jgi:phosphoglycerol transferase MdoB-like AlkP superfamily enzyme